MPVSWQNRFAPPISRSVCCGAALEFFILLDYLPLYGNFTLQKKVIEISMTPWYAPTGILL